MKRHTTHLLTTVAATLTMAATLSAATLDLADIVGGGDGTGTGTNSGIKLIDGTATVTHRAADNAGVAVNTFVASANPFVDGVFIPDGDTGGGAGTASVTVSSTALSLTGIADSNGDSWDEFWNGHSTLVSSTLTPTSIIGAHATKGITFDLDAMEAANPGEEAFEFSGFGAIGSSGGDGDVEFYVIVDGVIRTQINVAGVDQSGDLTTGLFAADRFLTLLAVSNGNDRHDWSFFGDASVSLAVPTVPAPAALPAGLVMLIAGAARRRRQIR